MIETGPPSLREKKLAEGDVISVPTQTLRLESEGYNRGVIFTRRPVASGVSFLTGKNLEKSVSAKLN